MDRRGHFRCLRVSRCAAATVAFCACVAAVDCALAQTDSASPAVQTSTFNENRIFGVMPNYQTVDDPSPNIVPLTARQKWTLAGKETVDPFNVFSAGFGAAFSQAGNQTPKYGDGAAAFAKRFGAAYADFATQNFFSTGVLACALHQDPRYFRKGPESGVLQRIGYSVSRIVIVRKDSGTNTFNSSGLFGMMLGIVASNAYYPAASISGSVMVGRLQTSLLGGVIGNLTSEFWPDFQRGFSRKFHLKKP